MIRCNTVRVIDKAGLENMGSLEVRLRDDGAASGGECSKLGNTASEIR